MSQKTCREGEPARGFLRCEAKEIGSDARPQSWERPEAYSFSYVENRFTPTTRQMVWDHSP